MASSITAAFQEVFGNKIHHHTPLDWTELEEADVWRICTPVSFRGLDLFGEPLTRIHATLQCFVSSYAKSQRWGAALMSHPADLDGLVYLGRRCGVNCLAMFGDDGAPRDYQKYLKIDVLGDLVCWDGFWPMLDRLNVRISSAPKGRKGPVWSL
jgi:hypothetical protein